MFGINFITIVSVAIIFFCMGMAGKMYRMPAPKTKKQIIIKENNIPFYVLLVISGIMQIIMAAAYLGNETDMNCFLSWSDMVFNDGISHFYKADSFTDYPPGYMYILYVAGALKHICHTEWNSTLSVIIVKMPSIIANLGTAYLLYQIARKFWKNNGATIVAALLLINPAVLLDGPLWGQTDSVFTFFIVLMCYLISEKKLIPAYFVFAAGILIKPQSLIFTPVLIFGIVDQVFLEDFNWVKFFKNLFLGLLAIGMIALLMVPFGFNEAFSQYKETMGSYEYASVNAYNFWALLGKDWASQNDKLMGIAYKNWGTFFIVLTVVVAAIIHFRAKNHPSKYYFSGAFIVTSVFCLAVRMHERYIYPAIVLLIFAYVMRPNKKLLYAYTAITAVAFLNIAHVQFVYDLNNFNPLDGTMRFISFLVMCALVYVAYVGFTEFNGYLSQKELATPGGSQAPVKSKNKQKQLQQQKKAANSSNPIIPSAVIERMTKYDFIALAVIMVIYGVVAFTRLGNMEAPKTSYSFAKDGEVIVDLGENKSVKSIWNFLGYLNEPNYNLAYSNNPDEGWFVIYGDADGDSGPTDSYWNAGSVFCWNKLEVNVNARYFKISAPESTTKDSMLELVLVDDNDKVIKPVNTGDYKHLFDEQKLFEGRDSYLNGTYFDEIYHARTAYEMIIGEYCYENTHPPMGKEFIALGILMFGMNPFGWRFAGTLFGVLMLPIMYLFLKRFLKKTWICAAITTLFAVDFMHFTQTRISTIDVFVTLFIMLSYYFMYMYTKKSFYDTKLTKTWIPLGLCGIAMGCSWACKWTGFYSSVGLAIIFFSIMWQRYKEYKYALRYPRVKTGKIAHSHIIQHFSEYYWKTIAFCLVAFVLVPVLIYLLSYIPFNDGSDRGLVEKTIEAQKNMYDYHSNLDAEHGFASKWYEWPIMKKPMWYYSGQDGELEEGITAFGNPLIWWGGIPAALYMLYLIFRRKDRNAAFLILGYLSQYAPWFLVGRVIFIYHYFPSVPFVTIIVGYTLYQFAMSGKEKYRKIKKGAVLVYVTIAVVLFSMFYPVLSAKPVSAAYVNKYLKWGKEWYFIEDWD